MTAITSIAFDHQQYLGSDARRDRRRKGRHHQAGRPDGRRRGRCRRPYAAIERIARERGAPLVRAADGVTTVARPAAGTIGLRTPVRDYGDVTIGLAGRAPDRQRRRRRPHARAARCAGNRGAARRRSCQRSPGRPWPGRLDLRRLTDGREMLLDAAHNPAGAAALASYLRGSGSGRAAARVRRDARQGRRGHAAGAAPGRRPADRHPRLESPLRRSRPARSSSRAAIAPDRSVTIAAAPVEALEAAWRTVAAHRRRRIDLSARRRHEGDAAARDTLRKRQLNAHIARGTPLRDDSVSSCSGARRRAAASGHRNDRRGAPRDHQREGTPLHRQGRDGAAATRSSTPTTSGSTWTRIARSRPATSSSARATTRSPPTAPSSTRRRVSAPSTTPAASRRSSRRARPRGPGVRGASAADRARTRSSTSSARPSRRSGRKKYKITNGGFTTCVQPTPRWDLHADTIVLNLDHYTLLRNVVLNVKGVPLFYLPVLYYPTKREDRATGFLLPTYGTSTLRGQSFHNAFFWAINRSQDATFMHDWFSKTGQGVGSEYRYNFGGGSDGNVRAYLLNEHATTLGRLAAGEHGATSIRGSANQLLPGRLRARAQRRLLLRASRRIRRSTRTSTTSSRNQRSFGGNVVGAWGSYSLNGTFDRTEYFYQPDQLRRVPAAGRAITVTRNERPVRRHAALLLGQRRVRAHPQRSAGTLRRRTRPEPDAARLLAADPVSVQEVAVVHGQLDGRAGATRSTRAAWIRRRRTR